MSLEKVAQGKPTGTLALTFYVDRKLPFSKMKAHVAVPPLLLSKLFTSKRFTSSQDRYRSAMLTIRQCPVR